MIFSDRLSASKKNISVLKALARRFSGQSCHNTYKKAMIDVSTIPIMNRPRQPPFLEELFDTSAERLITSFSLTKECPFPS
jgi:hypothetical protein